MKLNELSHQCPLNIRDKINRFMKYASFFLVIFTFYSFTDSYGQKTKFDLDLTNASLLEVIERIENQSEFIFVYNDELLPALSGQKSDVIVSQATIYGVLDIVLDKKEIKYLVNGRQVILKKNVVAPTPSVTRSKEESEEVQDPISGTVTDGDGVPLPGVNILIQGTGTGTQTDFDGNYTINANEGQVLLFSYLGMHDRLVTVGTGTTINVVMEEDAATLDEVVVTALGISREKKALGYAVQELQGDDLNEAPGK